MTRQLPKGLARLTRRWPQRIGAPHEASAQRTGRAAPARAARLTIIALSAIAGSIAASFDPPRACPIEYGSASSTEPEVPTVLQGRIRHVQSDERRTIAGNGWEQYMVVDVERIVYGEALSGTVVVGVYLGKSGRGILEWNDRETDSTIFALSTSYWSEGASVSIGLTGSSLCSFFPWPLSGERSQADVAGEPNPLLRSPLRCTNIEHLYLVDDYGFIVDGDVP